MIKYITRTYSIKPGIKTSGPLSKSIDKNIPQYRRVKAWERDKKNKDDWFRDKYSHIHAERRRRKEGNSAFIYGHNSVVSALNDAKRGRKLYYHGKNINEEIEKLCDRSGICIEKVSKQELNALSGNNVHNNLVLEAAPLKLDTASSIDVSDDAIEVHTMSDNQKIVRMNRGNPLGVLMDKITDPFNVGSIVRSCFYMGVDFALSAGSVNVEKGFSSTIHKASSGAIESIPVYNIDDKVKFITAMKDKGWVFVAATVDSDNSEKRILMDDLRIVGGTSGVILVLGSEGQGISKRVQHECDYTVEIPVRARKKNRSVDSLNVGVAAGILLEKLTAEK
ncbi:hypothetical protein KAFR_0G02050 [Kazachstania africana CBS 2517]|uniref:rRNA methyltransferase 1, mitochondrial n=1 Tax=Kazachstania africana (strain ATCC 22294 / BCRC 22015 / CBS 2517 / CECT 1963 / NBRC 1671 / NRRL Y-8276) TaxID=1071382 RepID=H2AXY9_KAZAF|nr:hypothetical protein KAFR_0G02050 [Kazachstania africana CBS 2517]CCF59239.1 hypothetical protein KAFR_0G02050 [Kazachstania africana CBS 2517]